MVLSSILTKSALYILVYKYGAVATGIYASDNGFGNYNKGVFDGCSTTQINHAVTVVGYETSATGDEYWIVKNSWGDQWGDNGFFKIIKGKGHCSIGYNRNSVPFCQTSFTEKSVERTTLLPTTNIV